MKITQKKAKELMGCSDVVIIDVRTQDEYDEGHIKNAVLIPFNELNDKIRQLIPNKNKEILVYCYSGARSSAAEKLLVYMGYKNVYDFGGIIDWPFGTVR